MLDSLAGTILDADSLAERQRRKDAWKAQGGKMKHLQGFAGPHPTAAHSPNVMQWRFNITLPHSQPAQATGRATGGHARGEFPC